MTKKQPNDGAEPLPIGKPTHKISRQQFLAKVREVLDEHTSDPVADLRTLGQGLIAVADALEGLSVDDARAVLRSVAVMEGFA